MATTTKINETLNENYWVMLLLSGTRYTLKTMQNIGNYSVRTCKYLVLAVYGCSKPM